MRLLITNLLLISPWCAADGPWNDPTPAPTPEPSVTVEVVVLTPDSDRTVAGAEVALGERRATTDAFGRAVFEDAVEGVLTVSTGHFSGAGPGPELTLSPSVPIVLDVRDEAGRTWDPVGARLDAMGLTSVRQGPETAAVAASAFAQPQGLSENDLILLGGDLDWAAVAADEAAIGGLEDFVLGGGGLVVSASARPVLDALAPGTVASSGEAGFGYVEAFTDAVLLDHLQWHAVGVPILEGMPLADDVAEHAHVALAGDVDGLTVALAVELELGDGALLWLAFAAPEPRADEWWQGDPEPYRLGDGTWDGRGAALDRLLLRL